MSGIKQHFYYLYVVSVKRALGAITPCSFLLWLCIGAMCIIFWWFVEVCRHTYAHSKGTTIHRGTTNKSQYFLGQVRPLFRSKNLSGKVDSCACKSLRLD